MSDKAKQKLFDTMDRIEELEKKRLYMGELNEQEELELRNLEVKKMIYYSKWKDPN